MSAEQEKVQPRNLNDEEIDLIRKTFDEPLLKSLRGLFFGLGISDAEKTQIKSTFSNKRLLAIMYKRLYPTLDRDMAIGQMQDVWMGVEKMIFSFPADTVYQALQYKEISLKYTKQALELLTKPNGKAPSLDYSPANYPNDTLGITLLGRNQFMSHIEHQLLFLWLIVQSKPVTSEEKAKKVIKDSSQ